MKSLQILERLNTCLASNAVYSLTQSCLHHLWLKTVQENVALGQVQPVLRGQQQQAPILSAAAATADYNEKEALYQEHLRAALCGENLPLFLGQNGQERSLQV